MSRRKPDPVGSEELKDAIQRMMVERFGDRPLDWEMVEPPALVNFEIKRLGILAPPEGSTSNG